MNTLPIRATTPHTHIRTLIHSRAHSLASRCAGARRRRRRARLHSAAAHALIHRASRRTHMRQHTSRPFHAPHRDENRPLSLASEPHEDGVRFPPHALMSPSRASQSAHVCTRWCLCAHALVCLCVRTCALVLRARMCLRGSAWMRLCARARACLCHPACASACMHATRCLTSPPTRMRSARPPLRCFDGRRLQRPHLRMGYAAARTGRWAIGRSRAHQPPRLATTGHTRCRGRTRSAATRVMRRLRPSHAAALPPDHTSPPNRGSPCLNWPHERPTTPWVSAPHQPDPHQALAKHASRSRSDTS